MDTCHVNKQLLDEVFVISRIIKVGIITLNETLIILDILIIFLLYIERTQKSRSHVSTSFTRMQFARFSDGISMFLSVINNYWMRFL